MKKLLNIPDYKIESKQVFLIAVAAWMIMIIITFLAEILVDLPGTTTDMMIVVLISIICLAIIAHLHPKNRFVQQLIIVHVFFSIEIHFVIYQNTFHLVVFWISLVPMIGLLIGGLRSSVVWLLICLTTLLLNVISLHRSPINTYIVEINPYNYYAIGSITTLFIICSAYILFMLLAKSLSITEISNKELNVLRKEIEQKKLLVENYQKSTLKLSKNETIFEYDENKLFKNICIEVAKNLRVNRVSIWFLENDNNSMNRIYIYELNNESDEIVSLERKDFPNYFDALINKPFIMAEDARTHIDTREFTESYLIPLDIYSMLDCPIQVDWETVGVICCENLHEKKIWNPEDALYVQSVSDLIALNQKSYRINLLMNEINEKNEEVKGMNEELHSLNEELVTLNESLESTVKNRTSELENQNKQLTEYAFINSHLLRAPLSRVLGLSNLISREVETPKDAELIKALTRSTEELDRVIRKISEMLYEGNSMTREDINAIIEERIVN